LGIAQVFKLSTYVHLVLPLGVIIVSYALFIYISGAEESFYASNTHWAYVVPHQVIFPLMSLVIAKIRKLPAKGEGK
jgi:spore germination protein KB